MNSVTPISEASAELARILDAYLAARQAGHKPSREQLLAEHPELADELEDCLASLEFIGAAVAPPVEGDAAAIGVDSFALPAKPIGDFRLVREIGRGGMGVVYEAVQLSLSRCVALKVLPFAAVLDPKQVARFKNEAQAAGNLDHPNIVSVYSVGCDRGIHYYAMQYVEGQSLAEVVEQLRTGQDVGCSMLDVGSYRTSSIQHLTSSIDTRPIAALSTLAVPGSELPAPCSSLPAFASREHFRHVARLGIQAAEALHYAHETGIVHRDIKPSNLLVDAHGHLWITDFGLATTQSDTGLTMTGDLLGTLRYMSPEQAAGDRARIDYRTDVYSLGITLYELLAGQPAFADTDRQVLLRRIIEGEPKPLRSIQADVPRDLETIVQKAIAREPLHRYGSAAELADDLQRFLDNRPVIARRPSRLVHLRRWIARNRLAASLIAIVLTVLVSLATISPMVAVRHMTLARQARDATQQAKDEVEHSRRLLYCAEMRSAYEAWQQKDVHAALRVLEKWRPNTSGSDLRGFEWHFLYNHLHLHDHVPGLPHEAAISHTAVSDDTTMLATSCADGRHYVWHLPKRELLTTFAASSQDPRVSALAISNSPAKLAVGYPDGRILLYDVERRELIDTLNTMVLDPVPEGPRQTTDDPRAIRSLAFSSDGKLLVSGIYAGEIHIWDASTRVTQRRINAHDRAQITRVLCASDGSIIASSSYDQTVRLWSTKTGESLRVLKGPTYKIADIAFAKDNSAVFSGSEEGSVWVWGTETGDGHPILPAKVWPGSVTSIAYSAVLDVLAASDSAAGMTLFRASTGEPLSYWGTIPSSEKEGLAFALNDTTLVYPYEHEVKLLDLSSMGDARFATTQHSDWWTALAYEPRSNTLAATRGVPFAPESVGNVAVWALRGTNCTRLMSNEATASFDVAASSASRLFVTAHGDYENRGYVQQLNAVDGALIATLRDKQIGYTSIGLSSDGALVAGGSWLGDVTVWDAGRRNILHQFQVPKTLFKSLVILDRGPTLLVGGGKWERGEIHCWDLATENKTRVMDDIGQMVIDLAVSPDGTELAVATWDGSVQLWRLADFTRRSRFTGHRGWASSVSFSPNGKRLASGGKDKHVRLWDLDTEQQVGGFVVDERVTDVAFADHGHAIAAGLANGSAVVWHLDGTRSTLQFDE